jgi:Flp pilus assembly protein TadG
MLARLYASISGLRGDCRGVSIVETAIFLPVMLMLMAGASDMAMAVWTKMETQQAADRAMEYATVAGLEKLSTTDIQAEAATAAHVSTGNVAVTKWLECDGATQGTFDTGCADGQIIGRYVSVRISNSYTPMLAPLLPASVAPGGSISFQGFSSLRLQ